MIRIYCGGKHGKKILCQDCQELLYYSKMRVDKFPFMETKTFCSNCRVHCYKPEMRKKIQDVMRYVGLRMMFYHPILAIKHLIKTKKEKKRLEKAS